MRRSTGDDLTDVWSTAALDEFLVGGIRRPLVRLVVDGRPLPGGEFTSRVRLGGSDFDDVVDPVKVARHFASGATVVAQSIHRAHPTVRRFVENLSEAISHPLQANSYLTPAGAVGLAPHRDRHDVFVLQIEGSKSWEIEGVGDLCVRPGDTVYIPAGTLHSASSTSEPSLHLTIGVLSVTYRAVLQRMLREAPDVLDDPLPLRYRTHTDSLPASIEHMLADVVGHLGSVDVADVAHSEVARRIVRPPRPGSLASAVSVSSIDAASVIARDADDWAISEPCSDGRVEVTADGNRLGAPESCRAAFEQIAQNECTRVDDLVGLDESSRVILARRLVGAGLCTVRDD